MSFYTMKKTIASYVLCCMLATLTSCTKDEKKERKFSEDEIQSLSETMGHHLYESLQTQHLKLNTDSIIKGIKSAKLGGKAPLSKEEYHQMLSSYKNHILQIQATENKKIADDFLAEMESRKGVVSLENGKVLYTTLQEGKGEVVKDIDTPLVNYVGMLINGTVFESTKSKGNPVLLPLQSSIPGFQAAVAGMKEGEMRRIFIHPDLGYGKYENLPPSSLLIFDLEVINAEGYPGKEQTSAEINKDTFSESKNEADAPAHDVDTSQKWLQKIREAIF